MKAKLHDVETCLAAAGIDASTTRRVCDAMLRGGHIVVHDGIGLHAVAASDDSNGAGYRAPLKSPLEAAADQQATPLLRQVMAQARRLGVSFDPSVILSVAQIDQQLQGKPVLERLAFKTNLAALGLIR
jgi:hypothetical protein